MQFFGSNFSRAQDQGLQFWQTKSFAIITHDIVPGDCSHRMISQNGDRVLFERLTTPRRAPMVRSRCSHLHQFGEEFLNSEVASEVPAPLSSRRIGGTGGLRGFIPPIVPERGCVELVREFMQGDYNIGSGSRERNLKPSVFGNRFEVAVPRRIGAIRRYEDMLRKNDDLLKSSTAFWIPPCLSLPCQPGMPRRHHHGVQVIVPSCVQPTGLLDSSSAQGVSEKFQIQMMDPPQMKERRLEEQAGSEQASGKTRRDMCDGQTLASPGRWPVEHRFYPDDETWRCVSSLYTDFSRRVAHQLCSLLTHSVKSRNVPSAQTVSSRSSTQSYEAWQLVDSA